MKDLCELAASRLLDGDADREIMAHVEGCPECSALARDISAFASLVERARDEVEVAPRRADPEIAAAGSRLRLVRTDATAESGANRDERRGIWIQDSPVASGGSGGAGGPPGETPRPAQVVAPARSTVTARRRILQRWPTLLAVAAMIVGVVTLVALLEEEPPPSREPERVVMREAGERAPAPGPDRPRRDERSAAPAPQPEPTEPPPVAREGRRAGPKDDEGAAPRRQTPIPSSSTPDPDAQPRETAPAAPAPDPDPQAEALAHRTLTGQLPRLRRCYERALRRDLRMRDAQAEISVEIAPDGSVQGVQTTGETQSDLRQCLEQTLRTTRFPETEGGIRLSVPLRFELVRGERMGSNVRRTSP